MSLTQEEINQKRREKILARTRKLELSQDTLQSGEPQNAPLLSPTPKNIILQSPKFPSQSRREQQQQHVDAFKRYHELQLKVKREKTFIIFSKVLGAIAALVQLYLLFVLKKYEDKMKNEELKVQQFQQHEHRLLNEVDLVFWVCLGVVSLLWIFIRYNQPKSKTEQKMELIPGSGIVSFLQQLNKVLQYKILIKAVLGYIFTYVILSIIGNSLILNFNLQGNFFRPNLSLILSQLATNGTTQQIL